MFESGRKSYQSVTDAEFGTLLRRKSLMRRRRRMRDETLRVAEIVRDLDQLQGIEKTERAFLAALGGDCHSAVAALANGAIINAEILSMDGSEVQAGEGEPEDLASRLLEQASPALRAMFAR